MKEKKHRISRVLPGSIGEELELEPGDILAEVNGQTVEDVFDYRYLLNEEFVTLLVEKRDGELWELEVEKEYEEDLGLEFENGLMDEYRSCSNRCIFCFIDQMPPGMRETLYFKDDDDRLSFLFGNYITLTNISDREIDRILKMHISPINVSVHTMDPALRCKMMHNRFAGESLRHLYRLAEGGIRLNCQLVLCPGLNDGPALESTLEKLFALGEGLMSVACVPVGLTRFREGLYPLEPYDSAGARAVLEAVERWGEKFLAARGARTVYASDEFYLLAGQPIPPLAFYEDFPQLENGVGMLRNFQDEFDWALEEAEESGLLQLPAPRKVTIPTGEGGAEFIDGVLDGLRRKCHNLTVELVPVHNDFFGGTVNVTGLLTGQDLVKHLKGRALGDELLIVDAMLKADEDIFLDDMTLEELGTALSVPVRKMSGTGRGNLEAMLGLKDSGFPGHNPYEGAGF